MIQNFINDITQYSVDNGRASDPRYVRLFHGDGHGDDEYHSNDASLSAATAYLEKLESQMEIIKLYLSEKYGKKD